MGTTPARISPAPPHRPARSPPSTRMPDPSRRTKRIPARPGSQAHISLRLVSRTTTGASWMRCRTSRGLHCAPCRGDAPQPGGDVRGLRLARPCGHRADPGTAQGGPDRVGDDGQVRGPGRGDPPRRPDEAAERVMPPKLLAQLPDWHGPGAVGEPLRSSSSSGRTGAACASASAAHPPSLARHT